MQLNIAMRDSIYYFGRPVLASPSEPPSEISKLRQGFAPDHYLCTGYWMGLWISKISHSHLKINEGTVHFSACDYKYISPPPRKDNCFNFRCAPVTIRKRGSARWKEPVIVWSFIVSSSWPNQPRPRHGTCTSTRTTTRQDKEELHNQKQKQRMKGWNPSAMPSCNTW